MKKTCYYLYKEYCSWVESDHYRKECPEEGCKRFHPDLKEAYREPEKKEFKKGDRFEHDGTLYEFIEWKDKENNIATSKEIGPAVPKEYTDEGRKQAKEALASGCCPECGGQIAYEGGCEKCYSCSWSNCG